MKKLNGIAVLLFGLALILTCIGCSLGSLSVIGLIVCLIGLFMTLCGGDKSGSE